LTGRFGAIAVYDDIDLRFLGFFQVSLRISLTAASFWHLRMYLQHVTYTSFSMEPMIRHAGTLIALAKCKEGSFSAKPLS
jgi:hypothetical protein